MVAPGTADRCCERPIDALVGMLLFDILLSQEPAGTGNEFAFSIPGLWLWFPPILKVDVPWLRCTGKDGVLWKVDVPWLRSSGKDEVLCNCDCGYPALLLRLSWGNPPSKFGVDGVCDTWLLVHVCILSIGRESLLRIKASFAPIDRGRPKSLFCDW